MTTELHQHAVEVDTHIAETYRAWGVTQSHVDSAHWAIRHTAGQRQDYHRTHGWSDTYANAVTQCLAISARTPASYIERDAQKALDRAYGAELAERQAFDVYRIAEEAYEGWSRFFLVTGGHIHSTMNCSTCYPTTAFMFLTRLSGLTEEDAVAEYGAVLCSICYPTAPVEHVGGTSDGLTLTERAAKTAEKDAEKAARTAAKVAKTIDPEHVFKDMRGHQVTTVAAAKQVLRDAATTIAGFGWRCYAEVAPNVRTVARTALTAKGLTVEELDTVEARAVKTAQKRGY